MLNAETKPNNFRNNWSFLSAPSCPDLNPLDNVIYGVLENRANTISHPNIGSLKTATENDGNKMSEEFILKVCKSFRRRVDTIIEKKWRPY